jgi:ferredoxin
MPILTFVDRDGEVHEGRVDQGADVMDAIEEISGIMLPHSCGRGGWCSTCVATVVTGGIGDGKAVTPMGPEELDTMEKAGLNPENQILTCSSQIFKDCRISQPTEDPPDLIVDNAPGR